MRLNRPFRIVLSASFLSNADASFQRNVSVRTSLGEVIGVHSGGLDQFLGLPYARVPARFVEARKPRPFLSPLIATRHGVACVQDPVFGETDGMRLSEDCLQLSITRKPTALKTPVIVFVHGGSGLKGTGMNLDGRALARRGVVFISVNYRLGILGNLKLGPWNAMDAPSVGDGGMNAALDVIKALRWVRMHIAAFGGNPGAVTIMGQSNGALLTCDLLASPLARGLFQRAILQSGPCTGPWGPKRDNTNAEALTWKLGMTFGKAGLLELPAEQLACKASTEAKRKGSLEDSFAVLPRVESRDLRCQCTPSVDHGVLPQHPRAALFRPRDKALPAPEAVLIGGNVLDTLSGPPYGLGVLPSSPAEMETLLTFAIGRKLARSALQLYNVPLPASTTGTVSAASADASATSASFPLTASQVLLKHLSTLVSPAGVSVPLNSSQLLLKHLSALADVCVRCPSRELAAAFARHGTETFVYNFDARQTEFDLIGGAHSAELPYVLGTGSVQGAPVLPYIDSELTRQLQQFWVSFARGDAMPTASPRRKSKRGGHTPLVWPAFGRASGELTKLEAQLVVGQEVHFAKAAHALDQKCEFWLNLSITEQHDACYSSLYGVSRSSTGILQRHEVNASNASSSRAMNMSQAGRMVAMMNLKGWREGRRKQSGDWSWQQMELRRTVDMWQEIWHNWSKYNGSKFYNWSKWLTASQRRHLWQRHALLQNWSKRRYNESQRYYVQQRHDFRQKWRQQWWPWRSTWSGQRWKAIRWNNYALHSRLPTKSATSAS